MMKVKLAKRARIWHNAGEIVEVSPVEADFLIQVCGAEKVTEEAGAQPAPKTTKRGKKSLE